MLLFEQAESLNGHLVQLTGKAADALGEPGRIVRVDFKMNSALVIYPGDEIMQWVMAGTNLYRSGFDLARGA